MNKSASKGSTQSTPITTADLKDLANTQQVHEGFASLEKMMGELATVKEVDFRVSQAETLLVQQMTQNTNLLTSQADKLAAGLGKALENGLHTQKEVTSAKDTVVHLAAGIGKKVDAKATELSDQIKAMDEALKAALAPKTEIPVQRTFWGKVKHFAGKALPLLGAAAGGAAIAVGVETYLLDGSVEVVIPPSDMTIPQ
jgi:hypothetical protein